MHLLKGGFCLLKGVITAQLEIQCAKTVLFSTGTGCRPFSKSDVTSYVLCIGFPLGDYTTVTWYAKQLIVRAAACTSR